MTESYIKLLYIETTGFELDASDVDLMGFAHAIEKASRRAALEEAYRACMPFDSAMNSPTECARRIRSLSGATET